MPYLHDERMSTVGLDKRGYGTHSMHWSKAAISDKVTGKLRASQILQDHTTIEHTIRYRLRC